jgi:hypothetical protein
VQRWEERSARAQRARHQRLANGWKRHARNPERHRFLHTMIVKIGAATSAGGSACARGRRARRGMRDIFSSHSPAAFLLRIFRHDPDRVLEAHLRYQNAKPAVTIPTSQKGARAGAFFDAPPLSGSSAESCGLGRRLTKRMSYGSGRRAQQLRLTRRASLRTNAALYLTIIP